MRVPLPLTILAVIALAACGGPAASGTPAGATATPAGATATAGGTAACSGSPGVPVAIQDFSFGPQEITTTVGGSVTWANGGATAHTVTFDGGPDCGNVAVGATVTRTFDAAGTFSYICTIHPTMTGSVVVE